MKKISKKEIRESVSSSLSHVAQDLKIQEPSKKTNKLIRKVSKKLSAELKQELKKQMKKMEKAASKAKTALNGKAAKAVSA